VFTDSPDSAFGLQLGEQGDLLVPGFPHFNRSDLVGGDAAVGNNDEESRSLKPVPMFRHGPANTCGSLNTDICKCKGSGEV
jgi:hypothetical protein